MNKKEEKENNFKLGLKKCSRCKELKLLEQFYKSSSKKDGLHNICKPCNKIYHNEYYETHPGYKEEQIERIRNYVNKNPEKRKLYHKEYEIKNKDRRKKINLKNKYGLTIEQVNKMLINQNNKCPICNRDFDIINKHIDHDHSSKKVRSVLCINCNFGLGAFNDNVTSLENAIKYLNFHSQQVII